MAILSRAVASLRIMGDDLVPDEVSSLLGAAASLAYARGDMVTSKQGVSRIARSGLWSYQGPESVLADIDAQVRELLLGLTSDRQVWTGLAEAFKIDLFCGWFLRHLNEGLEVSAETLLALGQRGIALGLDIYGGHDDR
ncbi:DUF4279 domain-containing protein [Nocardioides sp. SYSU DS0651]|uniref:DUF4279 domain-containing protein n=1 Tax=Nocardioides sp. SYSU DS0651 TaxID=3415955 RepID=UPI003F4B551F